MKLIMDGELYGSELKDQELLDKLNAYMGEKKKEGKVVKQCLVNGEEPPNFKEQLPRELKSGVVEEVEIVTIHQDKLAEETLESALAYMDNLNAYIRTISKQLDQGQGFERKPFLRMTDGLEWLYQVSSRLAELYDNADFSACHKDLYQVFESLNTCLEREDFTCLKAVLEDDLQANLNHTQTVYQAQLNALKGGKD